MIEVVNGLGKAFVGDGAHVAVLREVLADEAVGLDPVAASQRLAEVRQLIGRLKGASKQEYLRRDRSRNGD